MPSEELLRYFCQFISDNRSEKMDQVLENRTRHLTVVIENIFQPHNASAVIRSCDCFGVQDLHIIENTHKYKINRDIALGSSKWVDIVKHHGKGHNTVDCITSLKENGYKIIATTPHRDDVRLENFPVDNKIALLLGNEVDGLSQEAIDHADGFLKIPMIGFTESLNISVTAAVCMHHLTWKLRNSYVEWKLSKKEKTEIKLRWIKNILQRSDLIEQEFYNKSHKK
jgi:tRNA (guanosine-2'-O-)-methyltransferase